jgi:hypothetical protein
MAVMSLSSKMVFWKVEFDNSDMTTLFRDHIESITVKRSALPPPKNSESDHAPSEANISVVSKSYLEDLFVEGTKVDIYMGYDRILTNKSMVFSGVINALPDGDAQEMIKYNIHAFGGENVFSLEERSKSFVGKSKTQIIREILGRPEYKDFDIEIDISDDAIPATIYSPTQIGKTDLDMLNRLATKWGCRMWIDLPNKFYFVDSDKVQIYKPAYDLGWRTDRSECNVESVSWKHKPEKVGLASNEGGFTGFDQNGEVKGIENFKIIAQGKTWRIKPEVVARIKKSGKPETEIAKILGFVAQKTFSWEAYVALRKYYRIVDEDDKAQNFPPSDENSGMQIDIKLNNGDPDLTPPRKAILYYGSLNPRADTSYLPNFLNRWSAIVGDAILLNINETILSLRRGRLESELKCTIGNLEL